MNRCAGLAVLLALLLQVGAGGMAACIAPTAAASHTGHGAPGQPDAPTHHDPLACCAAAPCCMGAALGAAHAPAVLPASLVPADAVASAPAAPLLPVLRWQPPATAPPILA